MRFGFHHLRRLLSAFLCLVPLLAHADAAQTDLWLNRMARSMSDMNYRGVLSYARDTHLESLRVTHGTVKGEEFARLEHLDGQHREVIRRGKQLTCVQLEQRYNSLFHRHLLKDDPAELDAYYDVQFAGEDRIADRRAIVLTIKPRDGFRYGYRLALDHDTALLLGFESLDENGRVLERLQFVEVEIGQPLKKEWLGDSGATDARADDLAADEAGIERVVEEVQMPWHPQWLPPGFVLSVAPRRPNENVLTYSDGLAVMSVFVESAKVALPATAGKAKQGATVAYTRSAQFGDSPYAVTVVGEVPPATASRVAESVVWDGGN